MTIAIQRSTATLIPRLPMTGTIGVYKFFSAYALTIPAVQPSWIVDLRAQYEVTNPWGFPVMIGSYIARGKTPLAGTTTQPPYVDPTAPPTSCNITPPPQGEHHHRDGLFAVDTGVSGDQVYSLVLYCASVYMQPNQNYLVVEGPWYGGIEALIHQQ